MAEKNETVEKLARTGKDQAEKARAAVSEKIDVAKEKLNEVSETAGKRLQEVKSQAGEKTQAARDKTVEGLKQGYDKVRKDVDDLGADVNAYVRDNPGKSVLIAAGAGFVLGMLLRRDR